MERAWFVDRLQLFHLIPSFFAIEPVSKNSPVRKCIEHEFLLPYVYRIVFVRFDIH
jgi:hypothetical protein